MEEADYWSRGLLRVYGERPCRPRADDCFDEIASSHSLTQGIGLHRLSLATRLQQGFVTGEIGLGGQCARSNPKPLMSALGHKRTSRCLSAMSALPPKADIGTQPRNVRFVPKADTATRRPSYCGSRNQISGIDSSARRARRKNVWMLFHGRQLSGILKVYACANKVVVNIAAFRQGAAYERDRRGRLAHVCRYV